MSYSDQIILFKLANSIPFIMLCIVIFVQFSSFTVLKRFRLAIFSHLIKYQVDIMTIIEQDVARPVSLIRDGRSQLSIV